MNKKGKVLLGTGLVILSAVSIAGIVGILNSNRGNTNSVSNVEKPIYNAEVTILKNGKVVDVVHNAYTEEGRNFTEKQLGDSAFANLGDVADDIAVGNGSAPTSTSGTLDAEITDCGLARTNGTFGDQGIGNWNVTTTFVSQCTTTVNTSALFCSEAAANYDMFAGSSFNDVSLQSNDELNL